jgi:uncharacterized membrane protein YfcA
MDIFLPIARMSESIPVIFAAGGVVGLLSGLFGVGGGFLLTPLLMFLGISPAVAAASGAAAMVAGSTTGTLEHSRGLTVDYKMGFWLFVGGSMGSVAGVELIHWLNRSGPVNTAIRILYLVTLAVIGFIMLLESIEHWRRGAYMAERRFEPIRGRTWIEKLPLRVRFPKSDIQVTLLVPVSFGVLAGILAAMMGVGGGFIMLPLMLYVLRMRIHVAAGTSLFQILCTCMLVTLLQSTQNHTVDFVLAFLLAIGTTIGAMVGTKVGRRLRAEQLKILLAFIILIVACQIGWDLFRTPTIFLSHVAGE